MGTKKQKKRRQEALIVINWSRLKPALIGILIGLIIVTIVYIITIKLNLIK